MCYWLSRCHVLFCLYRQFILEVNLYLCSKELLTYIIALEDATVNCIVCVLRRRVFRVPARRRVLLLSTKDGRYFGSIAANVSLQVYC